MDAAFDLNAYLDRIGWGGPTAPTYETLAGVLRAHMERIPFENLDVLLGTPISLDIERLQRKLVVGRRGGYCFEHGTLFAAALERLGFVPTRHTARVVVVLPRAAAPRAHMFLTVTLPEGRFILDPGFGALAPRVPVPLAENVEAATGPDVHWMVRDGDEWMLRTRVGDKTMDCWVSPIAHDNIVDFEMGNYWTSTHPASPFVNRLMLRALSSEGRIGVMNRDLTIWRGAQLTATQLADRTALRSLLREHFGFDLPEVERLRVPTIKEWA